jgi:hypothetical protein
MTFAGIDLGPSSGKHVLMPRWGRNRAIGASDRVPEQFNCLKAFGYAHSFYFCNGNHGKRVADYEKGGKSHFSANAKLSYPERGTKFDWM